MITQEFYPPGVWQAEMSRRNFLKLAGALLGFGVVWAVSGGRVSAAEVEAQPTGSLTLDGVYYPVYGSTSVAEGATARRVIPQGRGFALWPEAIPGRNLLYAEWFRSGKDLAKYYGKPTYKDPAVKLRLEEREEFRAAFRAASLVPVFGAKGEQPERAVVVPDKEWYVGYTIRLDKQRNPIRDASGQIVSDRPVTMLSQTGLMQADQVQRTLPGSILGMTCFQGKVTPVGVFRQTNEGVDFRNLVVSPLHYPENYLLVEFAQTT